MPRPHAIGLTDLRKPHATTGLELRRKVVADRSHRVHPRERLDVVAPLGGLAGKAEAVGDRLYVSWIVIGSRTLKAHSVSFPVSCAVFRKRMMDPSYAKLLNMSNAKAQSRTAMRVSAIRFGADLWRLLEAEAARAGVSVSQYVREAALARASAAVARRGEDPLDMLGQAVDGHLAASGPPAPPSGTGGEEPVLGSGRDVRSHAQEIRSDAQAVRAQSRQISRHARHVARKAQPDGD